MITKATIRGFVLGLLAGLLFIIYRVVKYSDGPRRDELTIYAAAILAFGVIGMFVGLILNFVRRKK